MRLFWFVIFTGLFIYYFADRAIKLDSFTLEAILNNLYHFFAGFVFLAGMFRIDMQHKLRWFIILFIGILLWDEIYDFAREVHDTTFLTILFNSYLIVWGGVSGLLFSKQYFISGH